ncbi:MAG TPA: MFS transporter [Planctomycetota bacterium]|nr:MFS transporter [Planctomycetota bacterium]
MADDKRLAPPWTFVPGLYVLQGMPYFVVQAAANTFFAAMGLSPSVVGHWSSDLTLPWMLKPLWSPLVDLFGTKRRWLVAMSCVAIVGIGAIAWAAGREQYLEWTIAACFLLAFTSATYDVACDGYYMLALDKREQEAFVGVRNAFYRLAKILVTGGLVGLAGLLQRPTGESFFAHGLARGKAWGIAFAIGGGVYAVGAFAIALFAPRPVADAPVREPGAPAPLRAMLREYTARPRFVGILAFLLLYRFAESLLTPMISPFLLRSKAAGGLALDEAQVGWSYGTIGVIALLAGGLGGGWLVSRVGLVRAIWPMALAMHVPNLLYAWAAHAQPGPAAASLVIGVEQLGYGFGFSAYMVFVLQLSRTSRFATTHYAISTGLMGLSAWLAGRWSGDLVEALGFERFFWLVSVLGLAGLATIPSQMPRLRAAGAAQS